jgi:hypothetical protein
MKNTEMKIRQIGDKKTVQKTENLSLNQEVKKELNEYQESFKSQMQYEKKNIDDLTSTGFWFCAYFADTEQRDEFLKNAGLMNKMDGQYVNGEVMAETLKIKITKKKIKLPPSFRKHKDFTNFVRQ